MKEKSIELSPRETRVMDRCYAVILRQQKALGTEKTYFYRIRQFLVYMRGIDPAAVPLPTNIVQFQPPMKVAVYQPQRRLA